MQGDWSNERLIKEVTLDSFKNAVTRTCCLCIGTENMPKTRKSENRSQHSRGNGSEKLLDIQRLKNHQEN